MTDGEKKVLFEYCRGRLSREEFLRQFPNDFNSKDYVVNAIENAISKGDIDELDCTISLIWLCGKEKDFVDILNELLINPNHRRHQEITKSIQDIGNPSSKAISTIYSIPVQTQTQLQNGLVGHFIPLGQRKQLN
jgi:hypothetical protein